MTRNELIIVVLLSAFLWAIVGGAGYMMWRGVSSFNQPDNYKPSVPHELKEAGVRVGASEFAHKAYVEDMRLGNVTDILNSNGQDGGLGTMVFAGSKGAIMEKGGNRAFVDYSAENFAAVAAVFEQSGMIFMGIGYDGKGPGVLSSDGKRLWSFSGQKSDVYSYGDLNGDGKKEFLTRHVDNAGFTLYDGDGKKLLEKIDIEIGHVDFVDTDGDGKDEIVYGNFDGELFIVDAAGNVKNTVMPEFYFSGFHISRVPGDRVKRFPLVCYSESTEGDDDATGVPDGNNAASSKFALVDYMGGTVASFDAPLCDYADGFIAVPVKLQPDKGDYFAVLAYSFENRRSVLYIYSPERELKYMEVLGAPDAALGVAGAGEKEMLLLGSSNAVIEYFASQGIAPSQQGTQNGK